MNKMFIDMSIGEINYKDKKIDDISQIKSKIFERVINLIHEKKMYMLGPEKSKTAKFIVDNFAELNKILSEFTK